MVGVSMATILGKSFPLQDTSSPRTISPASSETNDDPSSVDHTLHTGDKHRGPAGFHPDSQCFYDCLASYLAGLNDGVAHLYRNHIDDSNSFDVNSYNKTSARGDRKPAYTMEHLRFWEHPLLTIQEDLFADIKGCGAKFEEVEPRLESYETLCEFIDEAKEVM